MKREYDFQSVGLLIDGRLDVKVPGTTFKLTFSGGESFVDPIAGIGYVALSVSDLVAEAVPSQGGTAASTHQFYPWLEMGVSGKEFAARLNDPSEREGILGDLISSKLYLAYSKFDRYEALTIPGTPLGGIKGASIDIRHFHELDVGIYDIFSIIQFEEEERLNNILALHSTVLSGLESDLPVSKKTLEDEVLDLVSKANGVYDFISISLS